MGCEELKEGMGCGELKEGMGCGELKEGMGCGELKEGRKGGKFFGGTWIYCHQLSISIFMHFGIWWNVFYTIGRRYRRTQAPQSIRLIICGPKMNSRVSAAQLD